MAELNIGDKAPDFKLQNQEAKELSLTDYKGKWLVLLLLPEGQHSWLYDISEGFHLPH